MTTVTIDPKPFVVDRDALAAFSVFARFKGMSIDEALGAYINSFAPQVKGVTVVGRDADGPVFDIPDALVYDPEYADDGAMMLPKAWDDDDA